MRLVRNTRTALRRGLTLLELIIVLAILIALASILVPILPGLIGRAETSSRATNHQESYKAIQTYAASYSRYPSDWDALTDGTATPLTYVPGFTGGTPPMTLTPITGPQANALRSAGLTRLQLMAAAPTGSDITFNPYLDPSDRNSPTGSLAIPANGTPTLAQLTPVGQFQLNLSDNAATSTGTYVVFGFGKRASIVGAGVNEAPVNMYDNFALSPDTRYSRYGVVFQVAGVNLTNPSSPVVDFARAKLVRVIRFGNTLGTGDDAVKSYWDDVTRAGGS